jgi:GGDEF domain-containing protein/2'-5' RNA ligase
LAKQFGATQPEVKPEIEPRKLPPEVQRAVTSIPRPTVAVEPYSPFLSPRERTGSHYVAAPNQESPDVRLGKMLPEDSAPALATAKRYLVDPFEKMAAKGSAVGGELAERALFTPPPTPFQPSPAFNKEAVEKEFPITSGIARGVGGVAGSTIADPRNWPFFVSSAARPILQRVISGGFGAQMSLGAVDAAKNLYQNWDTLTPAQRAELATQGGLTAAMAVGSVSHALSPTAPPVEARPTRAELAEHLEKTNFRSPEALRASWTAEQQARQTPVISRQEVPATEPIEGSTPGKTASQWRAERQATGSVDYDALARQNGAVSSTPTPTAAPAPTDLTSSNAPVERRTDLTERRRIADMTTDEMQRELLTSPVTGIPNRRAFDDAGPAKAVAMSDADGLKAFNDKFGYDAGNALLRAKADALKAAGLDAYHEKGDEFLYRGTSTADLQSKLESARQTFRNMIIEATLPDGTVKHLKGVDFSYGTGKELSDAETALKAHKSEREARGERVRGGLPGVAEVSPGNEIPVPSRQAEAREVNQPRYKNASTQVNLAPEQASKVKNAGMMIPDHELAGNGREEQPHITVKYGVHDQAAETLREKLANTKPFEATLGKIKTFPPTENSDNAAVVHAEVHAPQLEQLHKEVAKHVGNKADDFEFRPHITLAYVKPEFAHKYEGRSDLVGTKVPIDSITVSQRDGRQVEIPLGGKAVEPQVPRKASAKALKSEADRMAVLREVYKPGNVVKGYVGHDKVLDFKEGKTRFGGNWEVQVIRSDEGGNPLPGERSRWHATPPEKDEIRAARERLEASAAQPESPRVVPGARSAATGNETRTISIQDLTDSIRRQVGEKRPLKDRLKAGPDIGEAAASAKDAVGSALARLKGGAAALWDAYSRPPKWTDYEDATGKWSGADQANALDLERFTKAIKDTVPNKLKREAISNWIEAGGDEDLLTERTAKSTTPHRAGYEAALNLTDAEKTIARNIMNRNDATLEEAQRAGLLQQGVENYVRHIYADNPKMIAKVAAEMNFNSLQTKPSFTKQRKLPTYFDAEQLGFKPKDKDVGFLTASHERAFREALAARDYVKSLMEGKAADGRPLVATSWASAKELPATEGQKSAAYLVKPNIRAEEEYADYRRIDHPALRGWRWAGKTDAGAPIFVQGDALVHPEIYTKLKNNLGKSAVRSFQVEVGGQTFRPGAALLNVSSEIKHAILSFSGFHQTTLGIHALEHRTKPFGMPDLDLSEPKQRSLVDHGLMVAQYDAMEAFGEGLASGGLVTKIPVVGPAYHAYIDYLFKDYLPRVKMEMALNALERNTRLYGEKLSGDQLAALTARQANAAFGGLNYKMLGRNKTLQDVMRLSFMAPDFTEARARFAGQAAKPYGREQLTALVGGALAFYTAGRILNQMVDDDPHWDKPFSLVHGGKEYRLRTVQGDLWSAMSEPKQYVRNRLSPLASTAIMAAEGRDRFGRKQGLGEFAKDVARSNVPIPLQSWTKESDDPLAKKAFSTILKMVGVNESVSRSKAEQLAYDIGHSYMPDRTMPPAERALHQLRKRIIEEGEKGDWKPLYDARASRLLDTAQVRQLRHDVQLGPLAARVNHFKYSDFLKVFSVATPEEQKQLDPIRLRKRDALLKRGQRTEVTQAESQ